MMGWVTLLMAAFVAVDAVSPTISEPMAGSCLTDNGGCDPNAVCFNSKAHPGQVQCYCDIGYEGDGMKCNGYDPCDKDNGGCLSKAACSFEKPAMRVTCTCPDGFNGDGVKNCDTIDYCKEGKHNCDSNALCIVEGPRKFRCKCNDGFVSSSTDESKVGKDGDCKTPCPGNCAFKGTCMDGKCLCQDGFKGEDCSSSLCPNECSGHGACTKYGCLCNPGYEGGSCHDPIANFPVSCKTVCKPGDCLTKCQRQNARTGWGYDFYDLESEGTTSTRGLLVGAIQQTLELH